MHRRTILAAALGVLSGCSLPADRSETPTESPTASPPRTPRPSQTASATNTDRPSGRIDSVSGAWRTHLGDTARSGHAPSVESPTVQWARTVGDVTTQPPSQPLVSDGALVQASGRSLTVTEAATGDERWQSSPPNDGRFRFTPTVSDGSVYVVADSGLVTYRLDDGTSERLLAASDGVQFETAPEVVGGTVVFGAIDSDEAAVVGVDTDGTRTFRTPVDGIPHNFAAGANTAYVRTAEEIVAIATETGAVRWRAGGVDGHQLGDVPLLTDRSVVSGTGRGTVRSLARDTGSVRWKATIDGAAAFSPTATDNRVYVTDTADVLYAFDRETGDETFRIDIEPQSDRPGVALGNTDRSPVLAGETVVFPGPGGALLGVADEPDPPGVERLGVFDYRVTTPPVVLEEAMFLNTRPVVCGLSA